MHSSKPSFSVMVRAMANYQANGMQVLGLRKVVRTMKRLGVESQDLKKAFTRIGARALSTANAGTPVRSGALKGTNKQSKRQNSVYLYSGAARAPYAIYPHYGTRFQQGQFYLSNVVKTDGPWAVREVEKEMDKLIKDLGLV
jgi:HK97 gp10 family phage protein